MKAIDLMILDDIFPLLLSGFRIAEYNGYLAAFPQARVFSWSADYARDLTTYEAAYPQFRGRVLPLEHARHYQPRHAFCLFLNNIYQSLNLLEQRRIPFSFGLNPGGGFHFDEPDSTRKLHRVFASSQFRRVSVTQRLTQLYLLRRNMCRRQDIALRYGTCAVDMETRPPRRYPEAKSTIDVCFVAAKYSPTGWDKGWDVFQAMMLALEDNPLFRFHVVGGFAREDLPQEISAALSGDRLRFYGLQPSSFFPDFFAGMDFTVAPVRAGGHFAGRFDGFPTGCCVDAGRCGVIVVTTDQLRVNNRFSGEEIIIVQPTAEAVVQAISSVVARPEEKTRRHLASYRAFEREFCWDTQGRPRVEDLRALMSASA